MLGSETAGKRENLIFLEKRPCPLQPWQDASSLCEKGAKRDDAIDRSYFCWEVACLPLLIWLRLESLEEKRKKIVLK